MGPPDEGERRPLPGSGVQPIDPPKINASNIARPDEIDYGVLDFARRLGSLLSVPLITCWPASEGSEFRYPKGDRDKLSSVDNRTQLTKGRPGVAIMGRMGGAVAAVDVDPRDRGDVGKTQQMLDRLGVRAYAEIETPGGGRHFYVAGHPELATAHGLTGWPGIDVQSFGSLVFLPRTQRPKYGGAGYEVISEDLEALAGVGDPDGAAALAKHIRQVVDQAPPLTLTPDQVREYGLPSTPLKETERRADAWTTATGLEQTEIDALMSLQPEVLRNLARDAIKPFYDKRLNQRVANAREQWEREAQAVVDDSIDQEQLDELRAALEAKLAELESELEAFNAAVRIEATGFDLPPIPPVPEPEVSSGNGMPLLDSSRPYAVQSQALIDSKAYRIGGGS